MANISKRGFCYNSLGSMESSMLRTEMSMIGLISLLVFYGTMFSLGIAITWYVRRKQRHKREMEEGDDMEEFIEEEKELGILTGISTLTAMWVGGGHVFGTAEYIMNPSYGLIWCLAPVCLSLSPSLNSVLFVWRMRASGYKSMLDVFHEKLGAVQTALVYIPALSGHMLFISILLAAVGASLSTAIGISYLWGVVFSTTIALVFSMPGGFLSVSHTSVIQLICLFIGLLAVIPFALTNPASTFDERIDSNKNSWLGTPPTGPMIAYYLDTVLLFLLGGIPWQNNYSCTLNQRSTKAAVIVSVGASCLCLILSVPSVIIGVIALSADWNMTDYTYFASVPLSDCDYPMTVPLVMRFLTPLPVAVICLAVASAAIVASSERYLVASSSVFTEDIYLPIRNMIGDILAKEPKENQASRSEEVWIARLAMFLILGSSCLIAICVNSMIGLLSLCVDLIYCIIFPQLLCVVHIPISNAYGSLCALVIGLVLRFMSGEFFINLPPLIKYPWYDEETGIQMFPSKTFIMLVSLLSLVFFSGLSEILIKWSSLCRRLDGKLYQLFIPEMEISDESCEKEHMLGDSHECMEMKTVSSACTDVTLSELN